MIYCSVCFLAKQLLDNLRQKQQKLLDELNVTAKDDICVQIAALCHELGKKVDNKVSIHAHRTTQVMVQCHIYTKIYLLTDQINLFLGR